MDASNAMNINIKVGKTSDGRYCHWPGPAIDASNANSKARSNDFIITHEDRIPVYMKFSV